MRRSLLHIKLLLLGMGVTRHVHNEQRKLHVLGSSKFFVVRVIT
jgi:hypothetical protein